MIERAYVSVIMDKIDEFVSEKYTEFKQILAS